MSVQVLDALAGTERVASGEATSSEVEDSLRLEFARELHDGVAQSLTLILLDLEFFRRAQYGRESVLSAIEDLQQRTAGVLNELRRLLTDLRADGPSREMIQSALKEQLQAFSTTHGVTTSLRGAASWPAELSSYAARQVKRIVQEAAHNAVVHGGARTIVVTLERSDRDLVLNVADDGTGITDASELSVGGGLMGMAERALLLGGSLKIGNSTPNGTLVRLTFPEHSPVPA